MFKRFKANEFNRNVLKLMTGSTMAQAIPIAISPILTRLYSPNDFGILAIFIAITAIFGSIANGRYELAIVLPKKEKDSINLVALSIIISGIISTILLVIILFFNNIIIELLRATEELKLWLYFVPITVFFIGLFNAFNYLNTRLKTFGLIAKVKVVKSVTMSVTQLILGFLSWGVAGLISGQIVSHIFTNFQLARHTLGNKILISKVNITSMIEQAKRYKRFPLFTIWATFANSLSLQINSFFIPILYSTASLGHYSLVQRILGLPTSLISVSIGQVFFQKASEEKNQTGQALNTYKETFKKLAILSLIVFGSLFFVVEDLVAIVFGEPWRIAGHYAKFLLPMMFIRFIASPLTLINIIFERQKIDLLWQVTLLLLNITVFAVSYVLSFTIIQFFILYTTVIFVHYGIIIIITYFVSQKNN